MLHWRGEREATRSMPLGDISQNFRCRRVENVIDLMGTCLRYERNAEIFGEDEPADYLYKVVGGAVRIAKLMSDGRRQISAFYLPGDVFGLEPHDVHSFSAEAVCESQLLIVKRSAFLAQATRDSEMVAQLLAQTMGHLQRAQEHMLLLGRKNAHERIAAFLLDMSKRLSRSGAVELPMSRQDIADYLGLTIETVSRTLTQMERDRMISMPVSRRIVLRDHSALCELNDSLAA
jgi:CRP/FNR family nitrogen fixation transcriptional regulator